MTQRMVVFPFFFAVSLCAPSLSSFVEIVAIFVLLLFQFLVFGYIPATFGPIQILFFFNLIEMLFVVVFDCTVVRDFPASEFK